MTNTSSKLAHCAVAAGLVLSLCFCHVTAFDININPFIFSGFTVLFILAFSAVCILIRDRFKLFCTYAGISAGFLAVCFLAEAPLLGGLNYFVNRQLEVFGKYYPVPQSVSFSDYASTDATLLFLAFSYLLGAFSVLILTRTRFIFPVLILTPLLLTPCLLIVDTQPDAAAAVSLTVLLLSLFVGKYFRKFNPEKYAKSLLAFTAVLLLLALNICRIFPESKFERFDWQDNALNSIKSINLNIFGTSDGVNSYSSSYSSEISLEKLGNRILTGEEVMRVFTEDNPRKIYLRGVAYSVFDNNEWRVAESGTKSLMPRVNIFTARASFPALDSSIDVELQSQSDIMFVPYCLTALPLNCEPMYDEYISKQENLSRYTAEYYLNPSVAASVLNEDYASYVQEVCTQLDSSTARQLRQIAAENGIEAADGGFIDMQSVVADVAELVKGHGRYSLTVETMPQGGDFPVWFLTQADRGYCMHYATACTAMLRALGIPARYVTGYTVNTNEGQWTKVTSNSAHAWTEYYDSVTGWTVVDATPSSVDNITTAEPEIEATTAEPTEAETEPTEASAAATEAEKASSPTPTGGSGSHPSGTGAAEERNVKDVNSTIAIVLCAALFIAVCALSLVLRRQLRLKALFASTNSGAPNKRVLKIYAYIKRLLKYSNIALGYNEEGIVMKAKFSNHTVTEDEIQILINFLDAVKESIKANSPPLKRLYLKYIRALI